MAVKVPVWEPPSRGVGTVYDQLPSASAPVDPLIGVPEFMVMEMLA